MVSHSQLTEKEQLPSFAFLLAKCLFSYVQKLTKKIKRAKQSCAVDFLFANYATIRCYIIMTIQVIKNMFSK